MKNRSLATRLIVFILPAAAAIFLAAFAYNYYYSKQAVMATAAESAHHLAHETAYRIEVILKGAEKVPANLAVMLGKFSYQSKDLLNLVRTAVAANSEVFGVCIAFEPHVFDTRARYFAPYACRDQGRIKTELLGGEAYQYFGYDWYQIPQELKRPMWSEPYFDEGGGNIVMTTYSVPFYRETGGPARFQGVVTADVSLMWLHDIVSAVKIYQTGYAFLISQNGVFVTAPEPSLIMRESIFSIAEARNDPRMRELGRDMIRGGEGFIRIPDSITGKRSWMYYAPLPATGWSLGIVIPEDELFAEVTWLSRKTLVIGLLGLALLCLLITGISRTITRPLRRLAQTTAALGHGDFSVAVPETGGREIVHLAHSFNQLGEQLTEYIAKRDFIRDTFGRYVTQEVVKRLLEDKDALEMGGETREVSILMSDLRGFTALIADMEPEQVITFLNRFLGKMIEVLVDARAVIDEIVGDGILAFFGAPEPMEDHAARAVACALNMQAAMDEINFLNEADGLPRLEMGVAVNTGAVVVGNIGSAQRAKYSVVGAHVNFTSRIEACSLGGQVLISESTYLQVRDLVELRGRQEVQMKGVSGPVTIYEVAGIGGPYNIHLEEQVETLTPLPERLNAHLYRMADKVVTGHWTPARITHLGETGAILLYEGELEAWEDVRLHLLDEQDAEIPGKIYGKVISVKDGDGAPREVQVRFTSVAAEILPVIRRAAGGA